MPGNARGERPVTLSADDFALSGYNSGSEGIVATATVPKSQVWRIPVDKPLVVTLVTKQTVTVTSGSTESKSLDPEAPVVDYLPDVRDGEYTEDAAVVTRDSNGNLVTASTDTKYTGNFTEDGDFITDIEYNETTGGGDATLTIYTVTRHGYTRLQKRASGKGNNSEELQTEDSITLAFQNPDDPASNRQVTWDGSNSGTRGVIPSKFSLDLVFFDDTYSVDVEDADATNTEIAVPIQQRPVRDDEDPKALRRKVTRNMAGP
jgi:hypothetical protein